MKNKLQYLSIAFLFIVGVWYLLALLISAEIILPYPHVVLISLFDVIVDEVFLSSVLGTLLRALLGFLIASVFAVAFGSLAVVSSKFQGVFDPIVSVVRSVPTMSIILIALIWLKSQFSPVLVGILIVFPTLYSAFLGGAKAVDVKLIEMSKVYKVSKKKKIKYLYIPSIFRSFSEQASSSAGLNIKVVISGEVLANTLNSIGMQMQFSRVNLDTATILAWTVVAIAVSFLVENAVKILSKCIGGRYANN